MLERARGYEKPSSKERAIKDKKTRIKERKMSHTKPLTSLTTMVDAAVAIEKLRVASEVRQTHLFLNGLKALEEEGIITAEQVATYKKNWEKHRSTEGIPQEHRLHDVETDELVRRQKDLEYFVDGRVAYLIKGHPAYPWFSLVLGVGRENIGKVVGPVDIKRAKTISALWKFTGFAPDKEGKAMRRVKGGGKLEYNSQLRSMCWRLASSLKRARGKFYEYYLKEKDKYTKRFLNQGYKILPTPQGKFVCLNCGESWAKKRDIGLCCNNPSIEKKLREEPPGVIWLGHLDAMAVRKMIKLFLACLWLVWREAERLPITKPYAIEKLGHSKAISPWEMVDREAKALKKPMPRERAKDME